MSDIERITADPVEIRLSTGSVVYLERLRTRQFFKLARIITAGAGHMLAEYRLDGDLDDNAFTGRLLGLVILALPEAEEEAIDFLRSMTRPVGLIEGRTLTSADKERNAELNRNYLQAIINPELDDTLTIIEKIIETEASDIKRLGKRLKAMMEVFKKTGQLTKNTSISTPTESLEDSPEPLISSVPNTDGETSESSTSLSAV